MPWMWARDRLAEARLVKIEVALRALIAVVVNVHVPQAALIAVTARHGGTGTSVQDVDAVR